MAEIGLSGLLLDYPHSGTAVYTRHLAPLLPEVAPDFDFRLFVRDPRPAPGGVRLQRLSTPLRAINSGAGIGARLDKLAWEVMALPIASAVRRQALIHSLYLSAPALASAPVVVTVHDLIRLAVPDYHRTRQSELYNALMVSLVRRAHAIITVSEHSKQDIVRLLDVPDGRIHVTYEAADERFTPEHSPGETASLLQRYGLPERFLLYIGGAERRKNISTLVRAWSRIATHMEEREVQLVIVAHFPAPDRLYPNVPGLVRRLGLKAGIVLVDHVDEADKPELYRAALGCCFPSTYEGFGFTPLESMASGTPVIAGDVTSIPEVVGDAGLLLPPEDEEAWAEAMLRLVDSESQRESLSQRGLARAKRFTWRKTATETAAVYRAVLGR